MSSVITGEVWAYNPTPPQHPFERFVMLYLADNSSDEPRLQVATIGAIARGTHMAENAVWDTLGILVEQGILSEETEIPPEDPDERFAVFFAPAKDWK